MNAIKENLLSKVLGLVREFLYSGADFCSVPFHLRLGGVNETLACFAVSSGRSDDGEDSSYAVYVFNFFPVGNIYYRVYKPNPWEEYHYFTKGPHQYYGTPKGEVLVLKKEYWSL